MDMRSPSPMDIDPVDSTQGSVEAPQPFKRFRDVGRPAQQSKRASSRTFRPRVPAGSSPAGNLPAEESIHASKTHRRRGPEELQAARDILANAKFYTPQYIAANHPILAEILARPVARSKPALKRLQHGPVKAYEAPEKTPALAALTSSFSGLLTTRTDPKPKTPPALIADQRHDSRVATSSPLSAQPTDNNNLASTSAVRVSSSPSSIESALPEREPSPAPSGVSLALEFPQTVPLELRDREDLVSFQFKFVVEMWYKTSQRHRRIFGRYLKLPDEIKNRLGEKVMSDIKELNMYADDMKTIDHYLARLSLHEHIPLVIYEGYKALKQLLESFDLQETALDHLEDEVDEDELTAIEKYGATTPLQDQDAAVE